MSQAMTTAATAPTRPPPTRPTPMLLHGSGRPSSTWPLTHKATRQTPAASAPPMTQHRRMSISSSGSFTLPALAFILRISS